MPQYRYDAAGRLNQIFAPNFDTLTYLQDRAGRVLEQRIGSRGSRLRIPAMLVPESGGSRYLIPVSCRYSNPVDAGTS